jgi:AcrR family transcriptional regulator
MVHLVKVRSDAARNRARILEVARDLISQEGAGVSMEAIAAEAGVAVGTLYRHHPTKAALVEAVVNRSIDQLATATIAAARRAGAGSGAGTELAGLFRAFAERHAVDEAVKQAAVALGANAPTPEDAPDGGFPGGSSAAQAWEALGDLLASARAEGSVRADLTPADMLALLAGVPSGPGATDVRQRYIDIVLTGIGPVANSRQGRD